MTESPNESTRASGPGTTTRETRGVDCLSDLALDRLVADDGADRPHHVETCAHCAARLFSFTEARGRDETRALAIARRALSDEGARRPLRRLERWPALLLGAASAAVVAFVVVPELSSPVSLAPRAVESDAVRSKGIGLRVFVRRDGAVREALSGERFREGDALRLEVAASTKTHLMVIGVSESGALTVYHPFGGESAASISGSPRDVLPGSLVLDGSKETETLLVVAGHAPFSRADLESAIAREQLRSRQTKAEQLRALEVPGEKAVFVIERE
jgi:hypothetical protein